ncbi:MAG: hypothetical protein JRI70_08000, partial [Deltaproteobacteria bacterium]|nr:hypothetical protein [Deltaproteobacteria bacterium]
MDEYTAQMMWARIHTKELTVGHVGQPCHRVPVAVQFGSEGPRETLPRPSTSNVRIVGHVIIIIIVDKLMISHLPV